MINEKESRLFQKSVDGQLLFYGEVCIDCNDAALHMMGCTQKEQLLGRLFGDHSPPVQPDGRPSFDKAKEMIAKALDEESHLFEWVYRRVDGRDLSTETTLTSISADCRPLLHAAVRQIGEQNGAQRTLSENDLRFRDFAELLPQTLFETDAAGRITFVNNRGLAYFGYSQEDFEQGISLAQVIVPEDCPKALENLRRVLNGEKLASTEYTAIKKDGSRFPVIISSTVISEGGKPIGLRGMVTDITGRKQSEEELQRSEKAALQMAQETGVIAEIGRIISSSLHIEEVYERFADEVRKLIPFDRILVNLVNRWEGTLTTAYAAGTDVGGREKGVVFPVAGTITEEMIRTGAPVLFYAQSSEEVRSRFPGLMLAFEAGLRSRLSVPLIARGEVIGSLALWSREVRAYGDRDIRLAESVASQIAGAIANAKLFSECKQVEAALRESEESYRSLVETSPDAIFLHEQGKFVYLNPAAIRLFGAGSAEELYGKNALDVVHPNDREIVRARTHSAIITGAPAPLKEIRIVRQDGSAIDVEATAAQSYYRRKKVIQVIQRDITKRKQVEKELQKERQTFFTILKNDPSGVILVDKDGVYQYVNPQFTRITGYSLDDVPTGQQWSEKAYPDPQYRQMVVSAWKTDRLSRVRAVDRGFTVTCKDGQRKEIEFRTTFLTDYAVIVLNDITERKQADQALKESEARFKQLFGSVRDGIAVRDAATFELVDANQRFCEMWGYTLEELKLLPVGSLGAGESVEERRARLTTYYQKAVKGAANLFELATKRKDGTSFWVELNGTKIAIGTRSCLLLAARDITERKRSEEALAASEERYRRVVESSPSAIFVGCQNHLVFANPAAARLLDVVDADQLRGQPLQDFVSAESKGILQEHIDALLQGSRTFLLRNVRLSGVKGAMLDVEITGIAFDYEGKPAALLVVHDITEARQKTVQLEHMANHDALTRLPNRTKMRDRLNQALAHARRYGGQTTVIFLDLDHFKIINDGLGHDQGDVLLRTIADRLSGCLREVDTVARFGGDEFVIVLFDQPNDNDALMRVLERIQKCVRQPVVLAGREYSVSCSMGFAIYPRDGLDAETLLRNADGAMYRAKDRGRDNAQPYAEELHVLITERIKLHNDLRRALEREEFIVHYQPQANLRSGNIVAVEALVRWRHPDRGLMAPGKFMEAAEETGLIALIGELVLRTACKQGKAWQDMGLPPLRIAVNLSPRQFWQPNLLELVGGSLHDTGLEPHLLELELTESLILKGVDAVRTMQSLRAMGVELAIDDFGTGYSSLAYLKRFPIGRLKIAQAFLRDIPADPDSVAIARAVISLGNSLKLKVTAEGVETPQQLRFLEAAGCDEIQGYLLSKPLPEEEITELLKKHLLHQDGGMIEDCSEGFGLKSLARQAVGSS